MVKHRYNFISTLIGVETSNGLKGRGSTVISGTHKF